MKVLCPRCDRLLELTRYRLDDGALAITCSSCGIESRANASSVAVSVASNELPARNVVVPLRPVSVAHDVPAFEVPPSHCPKCLTRRLPDAVACASCGLVFANATAEAFSPPEALRVSWLELQTRWADEGEHEAVRARAVERGELAELGRLYRVRLAHVPDDPQARRGRDEVLRLAVLPSTVAPMSSSVDDRWKYIAAAVVILGSLVTIFMMLRAMLASQV